MYFKTQIILLLIKFKYLLNSSWSYCLFKNLYHFRYDFFNDLNMLIVKNYTMIMFYDLKQIVVNILLDMHSFNT